MTSLTIAATLLGLSAAAPSGADLSYFLGTPGGVGDVVVVDELTLAGPQAVPGLEGVRLLPLDAIGRSTLETFLEGRARLREDVPGAARVVLPGGAGSLYRFERADPSTAATALCFGFFVVDAQGTARLLIERPGTGPLGDVDPLHPAVAVTPNGDAILVATTVAAGGDAIEIDLATGVAVDRTSNLPPLELLPSGLGLRPAYGALVTPTGVLRFARVAGGVAAELPLPGAPLWFGGELVFSDNGLVAGTIAGDTPTTSYPFAFGPIGPAVRLKTAPAHLSSAGFLPGAIDGPYFAFSADGSVAVWRTEGVARDAWTSNVALVPTPSEPVTSDAQFIDTLDEVGLAGSFALISSRALLLAVGERADPVAGGIEALDFYLVESPIGGGAPIITNLSRTSGVDSQPFGKGLIDPSRGTWRVPGTDRIVVLDDAGSGTRLSLLDLGNGITTPLATDVDELSSIEAFGSQLLLSVDHEVGPLKVQDLMLVDAVDASTLLLARMANGSNFDRFALRGDGWVGLGIRSGGNQWVGRVNLVTGFGELLTPQPYAIGPTLAWSPGGRLAVSGGLPGQDPLFVGWGLGVPGFLAPIAPQPGFVLPGA